MPTPDFIRDLRARVGTDLLWLMGANAVVLREDREVLLVKRADTGEWTAIAGIVDPGENPAETARREALEEAGVEIEIERMLWLVVGEPMQYQNGDRCQFLDHGFRACWISGEPYVADEESTDVAWWPVDALPSPRSPRLEAMVRIALENPRDVRLSFT